MKAAKLFSFMSKRKSEAIFLSVLPKIIYFGYYLTMSSPLERFNEANHDRWEILTDVPEWERKSVMDWIHRLMVAKGRDVFGKMESTYNYGILRTIERTQRVNLPEVLGFDIGNWSDMSRGLWSLIEKDADKFILFLELLVIYLRDSAPRTLKFGLETEASKTVLMILELFLRNGSRWRIVYETNASAGLIEEVNENIRKMAEGLQSDDLKEAWEAAFQPKPKPELAIEKAQSAIEHTASKYGLTNAHSKVYGTLLGDIRIQKNKGYVTVAKPEYDLSNELMGEKSKDPDINEQYFDWVWMGLNLIQKTNPAHHRSQKTKDFKVSSDAAKQSVLVATLICEFIKSGYFKKINKKNTASA